MSSSAFQSTALYTGFQSSAWPKSQPLFPVATGLALAPESDPPSLRLQVPGHTRHVISRETASLQLLI